MERALDALRKVPGWVRRQNEDPVLGKVRKPPEGEVETREGHRIGEKEVVRYLVDDQDSVWYEVEQRGITARRTPVLAVPGVSVDDLLALVHCQNEHPGIGRTFLLLHDRFHQAGMRRDAKEYILPCGCRHRKRTRCQHIAMLRARYLEPWEVLKVDLLRITNTSETDKEYLLLVVDKASRFPFAHPLPSKEDRGVARLLLDLCLTFIVPSFVRPDRRRRVHSHRNGASLHLARTTDGFRPCRSPTGPE